MTIQWLDDVRACRLCDELPLGPRPIFQIDPRARVLIAGQAPGSKTHAKGVPFDDASGNRLREWLGVDRTTFYDPAKIAILPMAFCFPGTSKSGDLPPPKRCADTWRDRLLAELTQVELILVIGQYALDWHLPNDQSKTLTQTVSRWREFWPACLPMPHPSPRNNRWLKNNPWFSDEVFPELQRRVQALV
ncbi:MAG: uracil-DNA glycosylase family protein [Pseudomonadota bacterium]